MRTEEQAVIAAVKTAKKREDVVPAYVALIRANINPCCDANNAILDRWSLYALNYIKTKAWNVVDPDGRLR